MRSRVTSRARPRLSGAAYASKRQEPGRGQLAFDLFDLLLTANEAAPRGWQVVRIGALGLVCSTDARYISVR